MIEVSKMDFAPMAVYRANLIITLLTHGIRVSLVPNEQLLPNLPPHASVMGG